MSAQTLTTDRTVYDRLDEGTVLIGNGNIVRAGYGYQVIGNDNTLHGSRVTVMGNGNRIIGSHCVITGNVNEARGPGMTLTGIGNTRVHDGELTDGGLVDPTGGMLIRHVVAGRQGRRTPFPGRPLPGAGRAAPPSQELLAGWPYPPVIRMHEAPAPPMDPSLPIQYTDGPSGHRARVPRRRVEFDAAMTPTMDTFRGMLAGSLFGPMLTASDAASAPLPIIPTGSDSEVAEGNEACAVCLVNARKVVGKECGHFCMCFACVAKTPDKCPMCRRKTEFVTFFS